MIRNIEWETDYKVGVTGNPTTYTLFGRHKSNKTLRINIVFIKIDWKAIFQNWQGHDSEIDPESSASEAGLSYPILSTTPQTTTYDIWYLIWFKIFFYTYVTPVPNQNKNV